MQEERNDMVSPMSTVIEQASDKTQAAKDYRDAIAFLAGGTLSAEQEQLAADSFETAWASGEQTRRFYHRPNHYLDVAAAKPHDDLPFDISEHYARARVWPEDRTYLAAIRYLTGFHHDIVYHHVDSKAPEGEHENGFMPEVLRAMRELLDIQQMTNVKTGQPALMVHRREDLAEDADALVRYAKILFGFNPNAPYIPLQPLKNQNEFLSAAYAAQLGRELGLPLKHILQEIVLIEGTAPFQPADRFNQLEDALRKVNALLPEDEKLSEAEIIATIDVAVEVANKDVENFAYQDFTHGFLPNSRHLILEATHGSLNPPANDQLQSAMKGMYDFMEYISLPDSPLRIFHGAHGKPSADELEQLEAQAQTNVAKLKDYLAGSRAMADIRADAKA